MVTSWIACVLAACQLLALGAAPVRALRTGRLLRMHVVAASDSAADQRVKLCVRDAVQSAYADAAAGETMLARARAALPALTDAAVEAARAAGYPGPVTVTLAVESLDSRTLAGWPIPAGDYPALMVRLGAAQGRNWWGLIDRDASLAAASVPAGHVTWEAQGRRWGLLLPELLVWLLEVIP